VLAASLCRSGILVVDGLRGGVAVFHCGSHG
jgi:hypothetical protein